MLCGLVGGNKCFRKLITATFKAEFPRAGNNKLLQNFGYHLQDFTVPKLRTAKFITFDS
jgi:hypothetical protein